MGGRPGRDDLATSIKDTLLGPVTGVAARDLARFVQVLRWELPADEPINIVSHSQGTLVTLASLSVKSPLKAKNGNVQKVDNVILMNSPIDIRTGALQIQGVAQFAGSIRNYWDPTDRLVRLVNGSNLDDPEFKNNAIRNFEQIGGLGGKLDPATQAKFGATGKSAQVAIEFATGTDKWNHSRSLNAQDAYSEYAKWLQSPQQKVGHDALVAKKVDAVMALENIMPDTTSTFNVAILPAKILKVVKGKVQTD